MKNKEQEPIYSPDWPLPHRAIYEEWFKQLKEQESTIKNEYEVRIYDVAKNGYVLESYFAFRVAGVKPELLIAAIKKYERESKK